MLGVSLRSSVDIDLSTPLTKYIQSNYTKEEAASVERAVVDLNVERQRLLQALSRNEADIGNCAELFNGWYSKLHSLSNHFPFGKEAAPSGILTGLKNLATNPKISVIRVVWTWSDAFRHANRVSDYDINFEKSSVLFNVGSLYSRQATHVKNAGGPDAVKTACALFQKAAGVYEYMSTSVEVMTCSRLSIDLTPDVLNMLHRLMLAQAQACFFEKATQTVSPKIVAKIAAGTAELFKQAYQMCDRSHLKQIWTLKDVYNWETHCYYQMMCYSATSNYWYAKGLQADDEYGLEIAHLHRALNYLAKARSVEMKLIGNLAENRARLEQTVQQRLASANNDNDKIYYAKVPDWNGIRDPESLVNVKVTPFSPRTEVSGADPFASFVNPAVREAANAFQTRAITTVQSATKAAQENSDRALAHLKQLNLPASLEALEMQTGLPDSVWTSVREIQYKGGPSHLNELNARITSASQEAEKYKNEIIEALAKERDDDIAMRRQFGHKWNRRPSEQITANLQADIDSTCSLMKEAANSDNTVRIELEASQDLLKLLSLTREDMEKKLPAASIDGTTAESSAVKALIDELNALIEKRNSIVQELQAAGKLDIIPALVQNQGMGSTGKTTEQVFTDELAKLDPFIGELTEIQKQKDLLIPKIDSANDAFVKTKTKNDVANQRQKVIQQINDAVQEFNKLLSHFNEGLKFYNDLMLQKIRPLKQRVEDYGLARDLEKRMIFEQLTKDTAGYREDVSPNRHAPYGASSGGGGGSGGQYPGMPNAMPLANNPNLSFDRSAQYGNIGASSQSQSSHTPPSSSSGYQSMFGFNPPASNPSHAYPAQNPSYEAVAPPQFDSSHSIPDVSRNPPPSSGASSGGRGDESKWSCPACTYENPVYAPKCSMCDTPQPGTNPTKPPQQKSGFMGLFKK